ncbi:MAG: hypothetical protein EPN47_05110 [Acidobacteria bacterium]|nr:MAG: hypothetical protein EPN47_05110 [Acidobacteriota bacterium]
MTTTAKILRIVVASPSDVQPEREAVRDVIDELNRGAAKDRGLRLEVSRWETDAYPGFHEDGTQGLIDPILKVEDSDLLVGIFWKRFGKAVKDSKSGAEHEVLRAYEAWKKNSRPQIMVYFNQSPYKPKTSEEALQWSMVLEFQRNFPKEGLWWPYEGKHNFEELLRSHLQNFLHDKFPLGEGLSAGYETDVITSPIPDVRVQARVAVVGPDPIAGGSPRLMLVVTAQNHSPIAVKVQNAFLALTDGRQLTFTLDAVTGEPNVGCALQPGDSYDFFMLPSEVFAVLRKHSCEPAFAVVRDRIGREYRSTEVSMKVTMGDLRRLQS